MLVHFDKETAKGDRPDTRQAAATKVQEWISASPRARQAKSKARYERYEELLKKAGVKAALVAGEMYVSRTDGKRPRVHDVSRVVRQPESKEELNSLRFAVFDLMELDGKPVAGPASVHELLDHFPYHRHVPRSYEWQRTQF